MTIEEFILNINSYIDSSGGLMNLLMFHLLSGETQELLFPLRIVFIGIFLGSLFFVTFTLLKTRWLRLTIYEDFVEFFTYKPYGVKRLVKVWSKIEKKMEGASESEYKLAVIEADNILNDLLKKIGYAGQTLGEKLEKITSATISNIDELLEAHKTRNNIVHDPDYKLSLDEAKKILEIYKVALKSLEAL